MNKYETKSIDSYLKDFEKRFKLTLNETLFGPNWANLKKICCPICGNKLTRCAGATTCSSVAARSTEDPSSFPHLNQCKTWLLGSYMRSSRYFASQSPSRYEPN